MSADLMNYFLIVALIVCLAMLMVEAIKKGNDYFDERDNDKI